MKFIYHQNFYKARLNKIINIFGKDWFQNKKILELGACHGHIGIELLQLGADVTFTDLRQNNLDIIKNQLEDLNYFDPNLQVLNQEEKYRFPNSFDLTLHLGVLYHIENWKQDLECALNTSKLVILETNVRNTISPDTVKHNTDSEVPSLEPYLGYNKKLSVVCQESLESHITKLGCKFIRFDNHELNVVSGARKNHIIKFLYDWDYDTLGRFVDKKSNYITMLNLRRFYLIMT